MKKLNFLDGATGTRLWALAEEAGVEKVTTWRYNIEHPEFVIQAAREYIEAGSEIITANTFSTNAVELEGSGYSVSDVVTAAVAAAKKAAEGSCAKVALDVGPLSELLEPYGDLEEERAEEIYAEIMQAGVAAGCDIIFMETFMDLELMKIALREAKKFALPVFCSMTFTAGGRTMFGNTVAEVCEELEALGADAVGLNCSLGPELSLPIIKLFAESTSLPLIFKPNAGMPVVRDDGSTYFDCSAENFAEQSVEAFDYATFVGGCCGTESAYIKALKARANS